MDTIRAAARDQGFTERDTHVADARFDWQALRGGLDNLSLFAERKIVEVRLATGTPGREGSKAIIEYLNDPLPDTVLLISAPKVDKRTANAKWAKALDQQAVWVTVYPVPPERLQDWLGTRLRSAGLSFDAAALEALASRVEGNLLAAQQEISKLALLVPDMNVTADSISQSVADGARFDVFQLADAAVGQDVARAIRVLYGLRKEGVAAPLVLWALAREVNSLVAVWAKVDQGTPVGRAFQELRVWRSRQPLLTKALRSHNENSIRKLILRTGLTDRIVKGASPGQPWGALLELVLHMASPQQAVLNGYAA